MIRTNSDGNVICPMCGYDYIHPVGVKVNSGGDIVAINSDGVHRVQGKPSGRGVAIDLVIPDTIWRD